MGNEQWNRVWNGVEVKELENGKEEYWVGWNGLEWFGIQGTNVVKMYDPNEYPSPPSQVIELPEVFTNGEEFDKGLSQYIREEM